MPIRDIDDYDDMKIRDDFQSEQESIGFEFTRQLVRDHGVDPKAYAQAQELFGHKGLVDMVMLIGLYLSVCSIINAFEVSVPGEISSLHGSEMQ